MKHNYWVFMLGICTHYLNGQVGINTTKPQSDLDVNGKVLLRKELRVGGTDKERGSAGLNGQVLVSQGQGKPPVWKNTNIPFVDEGSYKLVHSYTNLNEEGISSLPVLPRAKYLYTLGETITSEWKKITNLSTNFDIKNPKNRVTYQFQTGVEIDASNVITITSVDYLCGVFRNDKLVAVRPSQIKSSDRRENYGILNDIYTLNYTETDVEVGNNYKVEVACRLLNNVPPGTKFSIGMPSSASNTEFNNFTLNSTIKVQVVEFIPAY